MIQIENLGEGRMRFATKGACVVEIMEVEGKVYVHSEPLTPKMSQKPSNEVTSNNTLKTNVMKPKDKELDDVFPEAK